MKRRQDPEALAFQGVTQLSYRGNMKDSKKEQQGNASRQRYM